ncbi:MAG TPA: triose-phosphate isomerase [Candidatus Cloacimonetes bacterium]|nr:triose-phosphate isomerase [Candidatus Cloacimonadota bacterium]
MRKTVIAANWKMNKLFYEVEDFLIELTDFADETYLNDVVVIVFPSAIYLEVANDITNDSQIIVGAQNIHENDAGAFTGEISAPMLKSIDVDYSLVGHSERRKYFNETDETVNKKTKTLLNNDMNVILCIGETLDQREAGITKKIVLEQLQNALEGIRVIDKIFFAYEPVWAIGTGKTATPEQAQEIHNLIRNWLRDNYSKQVAEETSILYGGSVTPENIEDLLKQPDIDGGLIGGASLNVEKFIDIINTAVEMNK